MELMFALHRSHFAVLLKASQLEMDTLAETCEPHWP